MCCVLCVFLYVLIVNVLVNWFVTYTIHEIIITHVKMIFIYKIISTAFKSYKCMLWNTENLMRKLDEYLMSHYAKDDITIEKT